ncbi:MAG: hypothetical protein FWF14_03565 [Streptococcaceae bacterium]|nr:hypothetical protein [Streptococcaceae bacterium]
MMYNTNYTNSWCSTHQSMMFGNLYTGGFMGFGMVGFLLITVLLILGIYLFSKNMQKHKNSPDLSAEIVALKNEVAQLKNRIEKAD